MAITIIIGLAVLSVLIIVHELGHFITAKAAGIRVDEFGLGYPPRLLSFKWGETRYSLNAIPFGGFNKLAGEEDPADPRGLASKSKWIRLLVLAAGSIMLAILPIFLFSTALMIPHDVVTGQVIVTKVAPDSPAAMADIEAGDTIISLNNKPVGNISDLQRSVQLNLGREIPVVIRHSDSTIGTIQVVPRWKPPAGQGAIGIAINMSNSTVTKQGYSFWQAIPMAVVESVETFVLYKNGIVSMIIGAAPATMVGPIGIVQITGEVARFGISPLLEIAALISLILAVVNLFPLPALDGGRIAFVLLEWIRRGRRISPRTENMVHFVGFAMLMAVVLWITYFDVIRIASGGSLIP